MNTDRRDKTGTHWWSFLNLHPKKEIFSFDSFGFKSLREFIIQDDKKSMNKIFCDFEKFNKKDNKITLVTLKFSIAAYKKHKSFDKLSKTTVDLMHLINEYGKKHNLRNEVVIGLVNNQLQLIEKNTCGIYQIYFYVNLLKTLENSSIVNEKSWNRKTIEKL